MRQQILEMMINYNDRKFRVKYNSDNGELAEGLVFHYKQVQQIVYCEYAGGNILKGSFLGKVNQIGEIEMKYQQINDKLEHMSGICHSKPEILSNGKIVLYESWQWTTGDRTKGKSVLEEL